MIQAADKAIAAKNQALKDANGVIVEAQTQLSDKDKEIQDKDKQLGRVGNNGFVMIGAGLASGALMAANVVLPGVGLLLATVLFTQVFKIF